MGHVAAARQCYSCTFDSGSVEERPGDEVEDSFCGDAVFSGDSVTTLEAEISRNPAWEDAWLLEVDEKRAFAEASVPFHDKDCGRSIGSEGASNFVNELLAALEHVLAVTGDVGTDDVRRFVEAGGRVGFGQGSRFEGEVELAGCELGVEAGGVPAYLDLNGAEALGF
jgi:hypothetical protein